MTALQGGVGLTEPPVESPVPPTPRLTWEPGPAPGPPLPGQVPLPGVCPPFAAWPVFRAPSLFRRT